MNDSNAAQGRPKLLKLQFSLRTFVLICFIAGPCLVYLANEYKRLVDFQAGIEARLSAGQVIIFEYQVDRNGYYIPNAVLRKPKILRKIHCYDDANVVPAQAKLHPKVTVKTLVMLNRQWPKCEELSFLSEKDQFTNLTLNGCDITSLDGIEKLQGLKSLTVTDCFLLNDVSKIARLPNLKSVRLVHTVHQHPHGHGVDLVQLSNVMKQMPSTRFTGQLVAYRVPVVERKKGEVTISLKETMVPIVYPLNPPTIDSAIAECVDETRLSLRYFNQDIFAKIIKYMRQLEVLEIHWSPNVVDFSPLKSLPNLQEVQILQGNKMNLAGLPKLERLLLGNLDSIGTLPDAITQSLKTLTINEGLENVYKHMFIYDKDRAEYLAKNGFGRAGREPVDAANLTLVKSISFDEFNSLETLKLMNCDSCSHVDMTNSRSIKTIYIENCPNLLQLQTPTNSLFESLVARNCGILNSIDLSEKTALRSVVLIDLPSLVELRLGDVSKLEKLNLYHMSSLEKVSGANPAPIEKLGCFQCPKLKSLPTPTQLKSVELYCCQSFDDLGFVNELSNKDGIEKIFIFQCPARFELESPVDYSMLKRLHFGECKAEFTLEALAKIPNLESLTLQKMTSIDNLSALANVMNLKHLCIQHDRSLNSVRQLDNLKKLEYVNFDFCTNLKSIDGLGQAKALRSICLTGCRSLQDVTAIKDLKNLDYVNIRDCSSLPADQVDLVEQVAIRPVR